MGWGGMEAAWHSRAAAWHSRLAHFFMAAYLQANRGGGVAVGEQHHPQAKAGPLSGWSACTPKGVALTIAQRREGSSGPQRRRQRCRQAAALHTAAISSSQRAHMASIWGWYFFCSGARLSLKVGVSRSFSTVKWFSGDST